VLPVFVACSLVGLTTVPQRLKPQIFYGIVRRALKARPFKTIFLSGVLHFCLNKLESAVAVRVERRNIDGDAPSGPDGVGHLNLKQTLE